MTTNTTSTRRSKPPRRHPRAEATRVKFTRKVELLEGWVEAGAIPNGQDWPTGPVALKLWRDEKLGVEAWSDPHVAKPHGRYADLRRRFDKAIKGLEKLGSAGSKTSIRERLQGAKSLNKALAAQVLTMRCQIRKRESALKRVEHLLRLANEREAALTAELAKLRPLRSIE